MLKVRIDKRRRLAVVSGWNAKRVCEVADVRPTWSHRRAGWLIDDVRVPDVTAAAEHLRYHVDVSEEVAA